MTLTITTQDLRSLLGPVVPFVPADPVYMAAEFIRLTAADGTVTATGCSDRGRVGRHRLPHAGDLDVLLPAVFVARVESMPAAGTVEIEDLDHRLAITVHDRGNVGQLYEEPTEPARMFPNVEALIRRTLAHRGHCPVALTADDHATLAAAARQLPRHVRVDLHGGQQPGDAVVAVGGDQFLAVFPSWHPAPSKWRSDVSLNRPPMDSVTALTSWAAA